MCAPTRIHACTHTDSRSRIGTQSSPIACWLWGSPVSLCLERAETTSLHVHWAFVWVLGNKTLAQMLAWQVF